MDPVPQLNVLKAEVFSVKLKKQNKDIKCTKNNLKQPFWQILLKNYYLGMRKESYILLSKLLKKINYSFLYLF